MQDLLQQTLSGNPPTITSGTLPNLHWRWLDEGILELTPLVQAQQAVVISAGIHGNETAPVEILNAIVTRLLQGELPLTVRLLVLLGNPPALRAGERYLRCDLNRLFGGRWQQFENCPEAQRALCLEQALETFWQAGAHQETRWHLDLHTAIRDSYHTRFGVLPFSTQPWPEAFLHWLAAAGMEALVFHRAPGGTFSHYSSEHFQAASCTLELGKALPFGHNDLAQFQAAQQALTSLIAGVPLPEATVTPRRYRVTQQITRNSEHFQLHMNPQTLNFTAFPQGTLLAEDGKTRYFVQQAQEYVLFPNPNVAAGLRAGLMLVEDNAHNAALSGDAAAHR